MTSGFHTRFRGIFSEEIRHEICSRGSRLRRACFPSEPAASTVGKRRAEVRAFPLQRHHLLGHFLNLRFEAVAGAHGVGRRVLCVRPLLLQPRYLRVQRGL